ncbi:MAG TPA: 3-oxoacyl-ACP reductase FabG [Planctomycetes bacterium]|nr:3-oxoacyl-ACP reductase FabG [Planctomycetota bacterium]
MLVTGASRGIGRAVALELGRRGFSLALNFRASADAAEALRAEILDGGGEAFLLPFDVSDRGACRAALEAFVSEHGAFWGVVLNAGITADAPLATLPGEDWDRVLRTNLDGFHHVLAPLVMPMVRLRSGGRIVTLSSYSGLHGNRGQTNYAASKAGLVGASKSLAKELAKRAITVNAVAPGFIETDMLAELGEGVAGQVPLRRIGTAQEVAALVAFLFTDEAGYITGQAIEIDGGLGIGSSG